MYRLFYRFNFFLIILNFFSIKKRKVQLQSTLICSYTIIYTCCKHQYITAHIYITKDRLNYEYNQNIHKSLNNLHTVCTYICFAIYAKVYGISALQHCADCIGKVETTKCFSVTMKLLLLCHSALYARPRM